ncbi:glycogen debranching protein GlgX [candidate division KSB1 bacterium]|nr:glycogen debranching protein GlgX [candidate division KSB1 bacterium]
MKISPGSSYPQGATVKPDGVNFALFSKYATVVFLLLFEKPEDEPTDIIELKNKDKNTWHVFVHGLKAGQLYAFKVDGKYDPDNGFRFNKNKCLLDPYAKAVTGKFACKENILNGYKKDSTQKDRFFDKRDNTLVVSKSIVIKNFFDWENDTSPAIPLNELIIYEVHLKGFTAHHSADVSQPGTYLGFIEKIHHFKKLGVNAVELLPIQESYTHNFLVQKGLKNYWGYDTIGFFAPEYSYGSQSYPGCQVNEFKTLVRELHKSGIEVILDVVYNHTGEGNELGPTLCFRGIDNQTYYALRGTSDKPYRYYRNNAGTGNILNVENPQVLQMVIDSLKYWVEEMHVDGFRFDLATILGLEGAVFKKDGVFFKTIANDPVLNKVKLIAEPWDVTTYQTGNFPKDWAEWNDKFRDSMRRFWKGEAGQICELAWRLTGSHDLFDDNRTVNHSINFVTCHDGFTLNDLYTYNKKHNEANGEKNNDGSNHNYSWNCGVEGIIDDSVILKLRKQMAKNVICCLLFSMGTPMILAGDEFLRTQQGNNNAYCQDNETGWIDWELLEKNQDVFEFFKKAIVFRKSHSVFRSTTFFSGKDKNSNDIPDIKWFDINLKEPNWKNPNQKILCYLLDGAEVPSHQDNYCLFFILNADEKNFNVKLPKDINKSWYRVVDTSLKTGEDFLRPGDEMLLSKTESYFTKPRSVVVLMGKDNIAHTDQKPTRKNRKKIRGSFTE